MAHIFANGFRSEFSPLQCFDRIRVLGFAGKESNTSGTVVIVVVSSAVALSAALIIIIFVILRIKRAKQKIESKLRSTNLSLFV